MNQETRNCQNCKQSFRIEPEDFAFYEKMNVPPPTFCPECRLQRRLMFRNERSLYRRKCDLCGKDIITIHSPDKPRKVYCNPCWWSDKWDASEYAMEYDPSRNFFEQFRELQHKVPLMPLIVEYPTMINSEYTNLAGFLKNCYLIFDADENQDCSYMKTVKNSKDCMDGITVYASELSYEVVNADKCFNVYFSEDIEASHNVYFSKNLSGCGNCIGCVNLRNKQYYIFNEPHSPEEYKKKLEEFGLNSFSGVERLRAQGQAFWRKHPHKYMHGRHNTNASGDYVSNSKNTLDCYINKRGESENLFSFSPSAVDIYPKTFSKPEVFGYIWWMEARISNSASSSQ